MNEYNPIDESISDKLRSDKQEIIDKDIKDIIEEFPVGMPNKNKPIKKPIEQKPIALANKVRYDKLSMKKFKFGFLKKKPKEVKPIITKPIIEIPTQINDKPPKQKKKKFNIFIPIVIILALIIIVALVN